MGESKQLEIVPENDVNITPYLSMINAAIDKGIDIGSLEKLLELQKKWEENESKKEFIKSMNRFKSEMPKLFKSKSVSYGNTNYTYIPLDQITQAIDKPLIDNGLSYSWDTSASESNVKVSCVITHVLGYSVRTTLEAPPDTSGSKNKIQAIGSTISYLQRYTLLSLLGMAASEDTDGVIKSDPINEEQSDVIKKLLVESGVDPEIFMNYYKIETIGEMKESDYDSAVKRLEAKIEKEAV